MVTSIIGRVADAEVAVRSRGVSQEILILATEAGCALARLLGDGTEARREGDYLLLTHDRGVDERLKQLADVVVALRYAHPTFVQLALALEGGGGEDG